MRNIASNIFADEFFGSLSKVHRLLWLGLLLNIADDQGRMMDNVALVRSLLFPYDTDVTVKDIEKGLIIFQAAHKILRYTIGTNGSGKRLIQIVNWWKYQKSTQWAGRSQHEAPPKWMDRIRAHETGGGITLLNWEKAGGYEAATKRLPRNIEAATKPVQSREDEDEVKGRGRRRAGSRKDSINRTPQKKKTAPLSPSNFGKGTPKGHSNLDKVNHGN
jgi:hypothetical protein